MCSQMSVGTSQTLMEQTCLVSLLKTQRQPNTMSHFGFGYKHIQVWSLGSLGIPGFNTRQW